MITPENHLTEYDWAFLTDMFTAYRNRRLKAIKNIEKPTPMHSMEKQNLAVLQTKLEAHHQESVRLANLVLNEAHTIDSSNDLPVQVSVQVHP